MFDFDRVGVAVLGTPVKRIRKINVAVYIPFIVPSRSFITYKRLYSSLVLLFRDKSVLGVQHCEYKMFSQLNIKSTY